MASPNLSLPLCEMGLQDGDRLRPSAASPTRGGQGHGLLGSRRPRSAGFRTHLTAKGLLGAGQMQRVWPLGRWGQWVSVTLTQDPAETHSLPEPPCQCSHCRLPGPCDPAQGCEYHHPGTARMCLSFPASVSPAPPRGGRAAVSSASLCPGAREGSELEGPAERTLLCPSVGIHLLGPPTRALWYPRPCAEATQSD